MQELERTRGVRQEAPHRRVEERAQKEPAHGVLNALADLQQVVEIVADLAGLCFHGAARRRHHEIQPRQHAAGVLSHFVEVVERLLVLRDVVLQKELHAAELSRLAVHLWPLKAGK